VDGDETVVSDEVMARRLFEKESDNFQVLLLLYYSRA